MCICIDILHDTCIMYTTSERASPAMQIVASPTPSFPWALGGSKRGPEAPTTKTLNSKPKTLKP